MNVVEIISQLQLEVEHNVKIYINKKPSEVILGKLKRVHQSPSSAEDIKA